MPKATYSTTSFRFHDSSGLNVPPVSLSNVPGRAGTNVPLTALSNVPSAVEEQKPVVAGIQKGCFESDEITFVVREQIPQRYGKQKSNDDRPKNDYQGVR